MEISSWLHVGLLCLSVYTGKKANASSKHDELRDKCVYVFTHCESSSSLSGPGAKLNDCKHFPLRHTAVSAPQGFILQRKPNEKTHTDKHTNTHTHTLFQWNPIITCRCWAASLVKVPVCVCMCCQNIQVPVERNIILWVWIISVIVLYFALIVFYFHLQKTWFLNNSVRNLRGGNRFISTLVPDLLLAVI